MSNKYQLKFNNLDGSTGFLGLGKNVSFLENMCDGICFKYKVPASQTTTTLKLMSNFASGRNGTSWGILQVELSEPVDEYITIVVENSVKTYTMIITPGKKIGGSIEAFDGDYTVKKIEVYRNKQLIYSITNGCKDYIGKTSHATDSYGVSARVEPTHSFSLTCENETVYVTPLIKKESNNTEGISAYMPAVRYNGEVYTVGVKLSDSQESTENNIKNINKYIPTDEADISEEVKKDIVEESKDYILDSTHTGVSFGKNGEGDAVYVRHLKFEKDNGDGTSTTTNGMVWVNVKDGEEVVEMPIRNKDGEIIDYVAVAKDKETGEIGDVGSSGITDNGGGESYRIFSLDDGSTVAISEDGSITINSGKNSPNGNTTTWNPTGNTTESGNPTYTQGTYNPENPFGGETEFDSSWFEGEDSGGSGSESGSESGGDNTGDGEEIPSVTPDGGTGDDINGNPINP